MLIFNLDLHEILGEERGCQPPFSYYKILIIKNYISQLISKELQDSDCFLVGVRSNESNTDFKFFIDGKEGVGIKTISKLSRKVSNTLDEDESLDDTPFRFEISSPGVDNPLIDKRQYSQHVGRELSINLNNGNNIEGELLHVKEDTLTLKVQISKQKFAEEIILFDGINQSTVKISFKSKKK